MSATKKLQERQVGGEEEEEGDGGLYLDLWKAERQSARARF